MEQANNLNHLRQPPTQSAENSPEPAQKQPFTTPKLTFIAPKLTKQGRLEEITADGFFDPNISPGG